MATQCSSYFLPLFSSLPRPHPQQNSFIWFPLISNKNSRNFVPLVSASSTSSAYFSSDDRSSRNSSRRRRFQSPEIEPLDVNLIQKDVSPATVDAMKRTISGMLGLLPSDQFQVLTEALWVPLSKLLVSSMMTGYTLRNAEYRLCLERNLDIKEDNSEKQILENSPFNVQGMFCEGVNITESHAKYELSSGKVLEEPSEDIDIQGLGEMSSEAEHYIRHLQSQLSSIKKDLHEAKRRSAALQMQQFVGEDKNDLLDYLRSLQPAKVAELSEPTSLEVKEAIHSVVHGLLASLSPKIHSKIHPLSVNTSAGSANVENGDSAEIVENTSLHFQPLISLTRDYLARLLFWCMLLGIRGLEYRMELIELLYLTSDSESDAPGGKHDA